MIGSDESVMVLDIERRLILLKYPRAKKRYGRREVMVMRDNIFMKKS